jgi:hypothetical protein
VKIGILVAASMLGVSCASVDVTTRQQDPGPSFRVTGRFAAPQARQGVAVDAEHVYTIDSRRIGKHDKATGALVGVWNAGDEAIVHLNSGVVVDGRLYCAHSNYPAVPMAGSVEVFDPRTLERLASIPLAVTAGSPTWVDRHDADWWVAFGNYEGRGGEIGRGPSATALVRFDASWKEKVRYTFPLEVVRRFGTRSNSGGSWGSDGLLYATGHEAAEIYRLRLPRSGTVLELDEIVPAAIEGQGIAWDRTAGATLYGIVKRTREGVVFEMTAGLPGAGGVDSP